MHHLIEPLLTPYYHLRGLNLQHNKTAVRSFKQSGWKSCVVFLKCENYMYPQTQVPSFCLEHLAYFSFHYGLKCVGTCDQGPFYIQNGSACV